MSSIIKPRSNSVAAALERAVGGGPEYPTALRLACNRARALTALERLRTGLVALHPSVRFHPVLPPDGSVPLKDARAVADDLIVFLLEACGDVCPITGDPVARGYLDCAAADAAAGHLASCEAHGRLFAELVACFARATELSGEGDGFLSSYADALAEYRDLVEIAEDEDSGPHRVPLRCRDKHGDPRLLYIVVENVLDVRAVLHDCNVLGRDYDRVLGYVRHMEMYAQSMGCDVLDSVLLEGGRIFYYRMHNLPMGTPHGGSSQKT